MSDLPSQMNMDIRQSTSATPTGRRDSSGDDASVGPGRGPRLHDVRIAATILLALVCVIGGCSQHRRGVQSTPGPVFYPIPPAPARIAYVSGIDDSSEVTGFQPNRMSRFLFGHDVNAPQPIGKPFGLYAGRQTLLVCDTQQNVVHVFDYGAGTYATLGESGQGRLAKPVAVTMDPAGNRYVADTGRREVVVFAPDNAPLRALGLPDDDAFKPVGVAFLDDRLYVLDGGGHRVVVLDPQTGALADTLTSADQDAGRLLFPSGLGVDADGRVCVTDMLNRRVVIFGPDGSVVETFGRAGDRAGEFSHPRHLAIGPDGTIYVVDTGFQRVQMFDARGRVLMLFGGPGDEPGSLILPAGVCTDDSLLPFFADRVPPGFQVDYLIFVSDPFGAHKVQVYGFGEKRG